ncbi:MAG: SHOCT domain-containing protein [Anaerolineae bacterium]|nr:SHOCT domain-containing protein [Anaerolineae bacterium]
MPIVGTFAGALAGGILGSEIGRTVGGAILEVFNPTETGTASREDVIAQLERLGQLRTQELITEEEFTAAKAKILGL